MELHIMNKQEIFDKVLNHMREQKLPARNNGNCVYYDEVTNRKCAIGCLIPTSKYKPIFDTVVSNHIQANIPVQQELENQGIEINEDMLEFLDQLQMVHDSMNCEWGDREEREMKEIVAEYSLNYTSV